MAADLETERDRLKGELSRVRAQLMALETLMSTNEHLLLKAPFLELSDLSDGGVPPWGVAPMIEEWRVQLEIWRVARTGVAAGSGYATRIERFRREVHTQGGERLMVALLPPPRRY